MSKVNMAKKLSSVLAFVLPAVCISWAAATQATPTKTNKTAAPKYPVMMKVCPKSTTAFLKVIEQNEPVVRSQVSSYKDTSLLKKAFQQNPGFYDTVVSFYPNLLPESFPLKAELSTCWTHIYQAKKTSDLIAHKNQLAAWSDCIAAQVDPGEENFNSVKARACLKSLLKK